MPNKAAQVGKLPSAMEVWFVAQAFRAAWFMPLMMLATIMPRPLRPYTNCPPGSIGQEVLNLDRAIKEMTGQP